MDTKRNTAAIYVRRSAADDRDADDSVGSGCGLPEVRARKRTGHLR